MTLTIIIVSYNSQFWLKKTLETLKDKYLDHTKTKVKVVVVDNNSEDDSVAMIQKGFSWVDLIKLDDNYGFAYANNRALEKVESEFVMLLNSDTELTKDSNLDLLLETLQLNPKIGVITPKVVLTNGELDPACHRGEPTPWASFTYFSKLEEFFPDTPFLAQYHQSYKDINTIHTIDACSGAAMIFPLSVLKKVGLLDEEFFMYAEDLDFCNRIRQKGYKILFQPQVEIIHHKNKSGITSRNKQIASKTKDLFYDTMLRYYQKHYRKQYPYLVEWIVTKAVAIMKRFR